MEKALMKPFVSCILTPAHITYISDMQMPGLHKLNMESKLIEIGGPFLSVDNICKIELLLSFDIHICNLSSSFSQFLPRH